MRFVENLNLKAIAGGAVSCRLPQFADFVDATVRRGINFNNVHGVAYPDFRARFANSARLGNRMILRTAIQGSRKDARHRGLSNPAMPAKNVPVGSSSLFDGILQRTGHVLLSDDLGEILRAIFAGQDGVTHEVEDKIIRDVTARITEQKSEKSTTDSSEDRGLRMAARRDRLVRRKLQRMRRG